MAPSICGGRNFVSPLKAMGLRINLRLNALASSLLRSPPGVCLWSPHHITRPLRGTLAMAEASSKFPYCWPSSLRATSTSDIHRATGLYGCVHSWWKPPPQPMITCLVRKTVLRNPGRTSSFVWLAGPFSSSVAPTNLPNFSSSEGGSCRDSICLAKACAAAFSLVTTRWGPSPLSQQSWQQLLGSSQPQRLHWWDSLFVLLGWIEPRQSEPPKSGSQDSPPMAEWPVGGLLLPP